MEHGTVEIKTRSKRWRDCNFSCQAGFEFFDHTGEAVPIGDRIALQLSNILVYGPLRDVLGMSKLRVAYSAGDAIAPDLLRYFRSLGINLKQLYGSTETGFFVAMQRDGKVHPETVGAATDGVELTFTPQSEILVRSPGLLKEYHRAPDLTRQTRNAEGWFYTGDAGFLGHDGQIRVIDRITNIGALTDGNCLCAQAAREPAQDIPIHQGSSCLR